jgi:hypothetical protein
MKTFVYLILVSIIIFSCSNDTNETGDQACDNGTFVGLVRLKTQAEVNDFGAKCYSKIDGGLVIGPSYGEDDDITDLSPLSSITEIYSITPNISYGRLHVIFTNNLTNLQGLESLSKVTGLLFTGNKALIDFTGLEGITELTNFGDPEEQCLYIYENNSLESLDGLNNLTKIGTPNESVIGIVIYANDNLQNLDGFSNLENVNGFIQIGTNPAVIAPPQGNNSLTDFCGLQNLFTNGVFEGVGINFNAYNPTVQDIINGNCSQ